MWGWEPATLYEYDDAGRIIASRPEAEWDQEQYGLVSALADVEADECPSCGQPMSECMSPDSDPDNKQGTHKYVVGNPHRCFASTARELKAKKYEDAPARHALRFPVDRVERAPKA